ncbi:hypothetical protein FIBSPDRAFT_812940 [Athelia psychrophila]|uniref:Cytochrome P450 n=1 Tax=Athelia psychrophila TaxID=1759441 RepID=A0A166UQV8_9AGAM|nr:hypothetical protein FIBSPDRAFT_812940 [Fibularhizoctonia sp. CBS 109695]
MAYTLGLWTALAVIAVSWMALRIIQNTFAKHPLHNIPGPKSQSLVRGTNLAQLFTPQGWAFHQYLADTFGSVVKIHSLLNREQLLVSNPKTLHHILIKDDNVYEETA